MATGFIQLNENDTKELRKEIGLPVTKGVIYWSKEVSGVWKKYNVVDYKIVASYEPSGSKSILITLENESQIRILSDYLVDMQKASFFNDIGESVEKPKDISGKIGQRIESNTAAYVVVDLETTGTNHFKDVITEIGAIKYVSGEEAERFNVLIKTDVKVPKKIEKLTGISNEMICIYGIEPKEACENFKEFLGDSIVVGHNFSTFDSKFLEDLYVKELNCHFPNDYIDTVYLAKKSLPDLKHYSLECLAEEYNIDYSKAHRALEDCVINHRIYEYLTFGCLLCDDSDKEAAGDTSEDYSISNVNNKDELVEVGDLDEGWQGKLLSKFGKLESEFGLMEHSFSIMANAGKDGKISSYAICVYEPDLVEDRRDSSRNTVLARVKEDVLKSNADIVEVYSKYFGKNDEKKRYDKDSDEFINCLMECMRFGINNYIPKAAGFACCSRYKECSDAKKCIHPNRLYAKACQYRKNLEEGNIFY